MEEKVFLDVFIEGYKEDSEVIHGFVESYEELIVIIKSFSANYDITVRNAKV